MGKVLTKGKSILVREKKFLFHHCDVKQFKIKGQRLVFVLYYFNLNMDMNEKQVTQIRTYATTS